MAKAKAETISIIPLVTIVRKVSEKAKETVHAPGPDAEAFEVELEEGTRLIKLGAAKAADEAEPAEDGEGGEEGGEGQGDSGQGAGDESNPSIVK